MVKKLRETSNAQKSRTWTPINGYVHCAQSPNEVSRFVKSKCLVFWSLTQGLCVGMAWLLVLCVALGASSVVPWPIRHPRVAVVPVALSLPAASPFCSSDKLHDMVFGKGPSLASVVARESAGAEVITGRVLPLVSVLAREGQLGPAGCNAQAFLTAVQDVLMTTSVELHWYTHIIYIAPNVPDRCNWRFMAESRCSGNGPCVMVVKNCADLGVFLRLWAMNQATPRTDSYWNDKGPLSAGTDPTVTWTDCANPLARGCHFVGTQLAVMGSVPPWRIREVHQSDGSVVIPLASLDVSTWTLPLALPQLIRIIHPTTGGWYIVSTRARAGSMSHVSVHSFSREGLSLWLGQLSESSPTFVDFASTFSIGQVSASSADGSCMIKIVFGCFLAPPVWTIESHRPLGYLGSTPVYERANFRFAVSASSSGTCLPSKVKLSLVSSVFSVAPFSMVGGALQNSAPRGTMHMFLSPGQTCAADTYFYRKAGVGPVSVDDGEGVQMIASQEGGIQTVRSFVLGDFGGGCWDRIGSFEVENVAIDAVADGIRLKFGVASNRHRYCAAAQHVELVVESSVSQCTFRRTLNDTTGSAVGSVVLQTRCFDGSDIRVVLSRNFGGKSPAVFVRRAQIKNMAACGKLGGYNVEKLLDSSPSEFARNVTSFDVLTFSFVVTVRSSCVIDLWKWTLAQQLQIADPQAFPVYPDPSGYIGQSVARTDVTNTWFIATEPVAGVFVHLDDPVVVNAQVTTTFLQRASLRLNEETSGNPGSAFDVRFDLRSLAIEGTLASGEVHLQKLARGDDDGTCVRRRPLLSVRCQQGQIGSDATVKCYGRLVNKDSGRCKFEPFTIAWAVVDPSTVSEVAVVDSLFPDRPVLEPGYSVVLAPQDERNWNLKVKLQPAAARDSLWSGIAMTAQSFVHESQGEASGPVHLEACDPGPLFARLANSAPSALEIGLRDSASVEIIVVNNASYPCTKGIQVALVHEVFGVTWNISGGGSVWMDQGFSRVTFVLTPWAVPSGYSGQISTMTIQVESQAVGSFGVAVAMDRCIPGRPEVSVGPCAGAVAPIFAPETAGESHFCAHIRSTDSGMCSSVQWRLVVMWMLQILDPSNLYLARETDRNTFFSVNASEELFAGFSLAAGQSREFNFTVQHNKAIRAGEYRHSVQFVHDSDSRTRNDDSESVVSVAIACPRPNVVRQMRSAQYTPLFNPAVAVELQWVPPCDGLCCRDVVYAVYRNEELIASALKENEFTDYMQRPGSNSVYRIVATDSSGRSSAGPDETCDVSVPVKVDTPNVLSFMLLLGGIILFLGLVFLIGVLVYKTRKIDLEIGRLEKVAEMHELGTIEGSVDAEPKTPVRHSSGVGEDVFVKALEDFAAPGPDELPFVKGDTIRVIRRNNRTGWWRGEIAGVTGVFPERCVRMLPHSLPSSPATPAGREIEQRRWGDDFDL